MVANYCWNTADSAIIKLRLINLERSVGNVDVPISSSGIARRIARKAGWILERDQAHRSSDADR